MSKDMPSKPPPPRPAGVLRELRKDKEISYLRDYLGLQAERAINPKIQKKNRNKEYYEISKDDQLDILRKMAYQKFTQNYKGSVFPKVSKKEVLNKNPNMACALIFGAMSLTLDLEALRTWFINMHLTEKTLNAVNNTEINLISGFLEREKHMNRVLLNFLFEKMNQELSTLSEAEQSQYAYTVFRELPELAQECAQAILLGILKPNLLNQRDVRIFIGQELTNLIKKGDSNQLRAIISSIHKSPQLQAELKTCLDNGHITIEVFDWVQNNLKGLQSIDQRISPVVSRYKNLTNVDPSNDNAPVQVSTLKPPSKMRK